MKKIIIFILFLKTDFFKNEKENNFVGFLIIYSLFKIIKEIIHSKYNYKMIQKNMRSKPIEII